jgi:heme/copper-type cytochrome/quinol oxidase subunit 2
MYKKMNSNQKSVYKIVIPFILFAMVFMVTFSACRDIREETETITENSQKTTDVFSVPEIDYNDEVPAVDDTYVIETTNDDYVYTFNYETRSPDEIIKGEYLTVAQVTTLPFTQPNTNENIDAQE